MKPMKSYRDLSNTHGDVQYSTIVKCGFNFSWQGIKHVQLDDPLQALANGLLSTLFAGHSSRCLPYTVYLLWLSLP